MDDLRLAKQFASADPGLLVDQEGVPIPLNKLPPEVRIAIQSVDVVSAQYDEDGKASAFGYRYRFADKNSAFDKLFRHLGLYEKESQQADREGEPAGGWWHPGADGGDPRKG